jgi:hypothetical protein
MFLVKLFYTPTELLGEIFQKTAVETFINFLPKLLSRYADWTLGCE